MNRVSISSSIFEEIREAGFSVAAACRRAAVSYNRAFQGRLSQDEVDRLREALRQLVDDAKNQR
jgi:molybdenum-dependent DNA-binding transcriptional regulator ModE